MRFDAATSAADAKGGRNQELALALLHALRRQPPAATATGAGRAFAFASLGSDGQDGPTDAAGAIVTSADLGGDDDDATLTGDAECALARKTSYEFWLRHKAGAQHVKTGPTGCNFTDVQLLLFSQT